MEPTVAFAVAATLMFVALLVALLAVAVLGVWLWMDARQRQRKQDAYEAWLLERAYEEPFDTVLPASGLPPESFQRELPKAEGLYGYFDDTTGGSQVTRGESFPIGKLSDYYHGDDEEDEAATEIFSAHASGELMNLALGDSEDSGAA